MATSVEPGQVFERAQAREIILDVRTPAEFAQGHIPGAVNLPLFSNDERAEVGTIYRKTNPEQAFQRGLEIVGPKLPDLVRFARRAGNGSNILVHCWRGGQRSASVAWLLETAGMKVEVIRGGYKAYRAYQRQWLENTTFNFCMLSGYTGSGKTELLHVLGKLGEQVLDLEAIAKHKGSAFGWIGQSDQPTTEQFENEMIYHLRAFSTDRRIWIESESRRIGKNFLPDALWMHMQKAQIIHAEVPFAERAQRLVSGYANGNNDEALFASFRKIRDRMGFQHYQQAIDALQKKDYLTAAEIALAYYDKTYKHSLSGYPEDQITHLEFLSDQDLHVRARQLLEVVQRFEGHFIERYGN